MERLKNLNKILLKQKIEIFESLTDIQSKNKYVIMDNYNNELYFSKEDSPIHHRLFLGNLRPLKINIINKEGISIITINKFFRFIFDEAEVYSLNNKRIGYIKKLFSLFKKKIKILDEYQREIFYIETELFHPWTFYVYKNGLKSCKIIKKWSGLGKEYFTRADDFEIEFTEEATLEDKALILSGALFIDLVYFEKK